MKAGFFEGLLIVFGYIGMLVIFPMISPVKISDNKKVKNLYPIREQELERAKSYLKDVPILGVEAQWGDGKSFFIDRLRKELENEYDIVTVDLLACNLDDVSSIIVEELEKVLYQNGIVSKSSKRLKKYFDSGKDLNLITNIFQNKSDTYTEIFRDFKKELQIMDRKVLIIFEDLDRVGDEENIRKIFYISEKLATELNYDSNDIKVIYQYDSAKLQQTLKEIADPNYIEKYIPYHMKLSKISFNDVVNELIPRMEYITRGDLDIFPMNSRSINVFMPDSILPDNEVMNKVNHIFSGLYTIRKIEHFIEELDNIFKYNNYLLKFKLDVCKVIFLKHFLPEIYDEFQVGQGISNVFLYKNEEEDIFSRKLKKEEISEFNDKQFTLWAAYRLLIYNEKDDKNESEPYEHIEKVIWHLIDININYKSDYTVISEHIKNIFDDCDKNDEKIIYKKRYDSFRNDIRLGNIRLTQEKSNIFVNKPWELYFKAYFHEEIFLSKKYAEKLIMLFFYTNETSLIDEGFVNNLEYFINNANVNLLGIFMSWFLKVEYLKNGGNAYDKFFMCVINRAEELGYIQDTDFVANVGGTVFSKDAFSQIQTKMEDRVDILNIVKDQCFLPKRDQLRLNYMKLLVKFCKEVVKWYESSRYTDNKGPDRNRTYIMTEEEFMTKMRETTDKEIKKKLINDYGENVRVYQLIDTLGKLERSDTDGADDKN